MFVQIIFSVGESHLTLKLIQVLICKHANVLVWNKTTCRTQIFILGRKYIAQKYITNILWAQNWECFSQNVVWICSLPVKDILPSFAFTEGCFSVHVVFSWIQITLRLGTLSLSLTHTRTDALNRTSPTHLHTHTHTHTQSHIHVRTHTHSAWKVFHVQLSTSLSQGLTLSFR